MEGEAGDEAIGKVE